MNCFRLIQALQDKLHVRTIARSIRDYTLAESCGLGQYYDKDRTQINTNNQLYPIRQ